MSLLGTVATIATTLGVLGSLIETAQLDQQRYGKLVPGDLLKAALDGATTLPLTIIGVGSAMLTGKDILPDAYFSTDDMIPMKHFRALDTYHQPSSATTSTIAGLRGLPITHAMMHRARQDPDFSAVIERALWHIHTKGNLNGYAY